MSVRDLKKKSETDWARIDRMTDDEINTSDIPPLDDAFFERAIRVLPRRRVDRIDLIKAKKFAAHILNKGWPTKKPNLVHDAFNIALIVSYVKPFSSRRDLERCNESRLDDDVEITNILDEEERKLHCRIKELRNRSFAHSDAQSVLLRGIDYSKDFCPMKLELNLPRKEVALLTKMIDKWINYLDDQILLTKNSAFLIAPDAES
jgi:hypothetical protein